LQHCRIEHDEAPAFVRGSRSGLRTVSVPLLPLHGCRRVPRRARVSGDRQLPSRPRKSYSRKAAEENQG
jgi:hypothetical protein